jgi:hypothetical protein
MRSHGVVARTRRKPPQLRSSRNTHLAVPSATPLPVHAPDDEGSRCLFFPSPRVRRRGISHSVRTSFLAAESGAKNFKIGFKNSRLNLFT